MVFGEKFNKPVDNLPKDLKYITFGNDFNESVDMLPQSKIDRGESRG